MSLPPSVMLGIFGVIETGLLIGAIYVMTQLVGGKDDANEMSKNVVAIVTLLSFIVVLHTLMWYVYLIYNPLSLNLYLIITTSVCLIFSLASLGISITNRA